ncbi:MAG: hypothetical protein CYPHOPRED_003515 [Cyphobasidiales sp. Tagirdzhanova-0007]|nr:MAG: hypothetical protein CYPHOPRED_003515 [Cyphobasidiales sp. Tagirdzhanova-0007]
MSGIKGSKEPGTETLDDSELPNETESLTPEEGSDQESDTGKLKQLLSVLRKVVGVKDLANLRLSLPANLLEPSGNLEWWHYLDRPDLFAAIGEKELDPLTRFTAILRWMTCATSEGGLGEQFRCIWEVTPASPHEFMVHQDVSDVSRPDLGYPSASQAVSQPVSPALSAKRNDLPKSMSTLSLSNDTSSASHKKGRSSFSGSSGSSQANPDLPSKSCAPGPCKVVFLNEQISHHPPISAFWYESTASTSRAAVQATGVDQIAAKFNGTSVKIGPGSQNKGIFIRAPSATPDEYQITHAGGYISGLLSAKPYITLCDHTYVNTITPGGNGQVYKAIVQYSDESWISKPRFLVEGVIYEAASGSANHERIKQVPETAIVARIKGTWRGKIIIKKTKSDKAESVLLDMTKLDVVPKRVRPVVKQHEMETRRFWEPVSNAINRKDYKQATLHKQTIEQAQRDKAAVMAKNNVEFVPSFFSPDISTGRASLTANGKVGLKKEFDLVDYHP